MRANTRTQKIRIHSFGDSYEQKKNSHCSSLEERESSSPAESTKKHDVVSHTNLKGMQKNAGSVLKSKG